MRLASQMTLPLRNGVLRGGAFSSAFRPMNPWRGLLWRLRPDPVGNRWAGTGFV